jgi:penicillin-binding protein 1A
MLEPPTKMSRRLRQHRRRRSQRGPSRAVFIVLGTFLATVIVAVCAGLGYIVSVAATAPDISELKPLDQGATSAVYARDGKQRLGFIQGDVLRTPVRSTSMPDTIRQATVAIEDRRFYEHQGVDFEGVVRAAIKNISSRETVEGGSTLTMQLVKNLYTKDRSRTGLEGYKRKVREAKLASELEDRHPGPRGKAWILTQYLNNAPYGTVGGQQAVGIEAAARIFFDKPARRLTLAESALLAGLPQAPSRYNPFLDHAAAQRRRNEVLRRMADEGYITRETSERAQAEPLGVKKGEYYAKRRESYFFDYVKQQLIDEYGAARVRQGGLKVYTTVDLKLQQEARKAIANRLPNPGDPSAALVSMDPKTGYIKAMASSGEYSASKFNLAAQGKRQPGSVFKVMVLMAALRENVDIRKTTYDSKPLKFVDKKTGVPIDVNTDDHRYRGSVSIFEGLVASDNTVYQQLDLDIGPEAVRDTAYDMGVTSKLDAYPAEGLGGLTRGVSPLEMTRAFVTVNNGGYRVKPIAITKVVFPDGHVDRSLGKPRKVKVFTDGQTSEAVKAMEANAQRGTGTAAQIGCPIAGKTGTTNDYVDAWFDGFTTSLNTTVWVGYPEASRSMSAVPGYGAMFGGKAPALIWHDFMTTAMKNRPCDPFPEPKEPFEPVPFFGEYATTGAPGGGSDPLAVTDEPSAEKDEDKKDKKDEDKAQPDEDGNYPPTQYEAPPQTTPAPVPTTPQAAPENGGVAPTG